MAVEQGKGPGLLKILEAIKKAAEATQKAERPIFRPPAKKIVFVGEAVAKKIGEETKKLGKKPEATTTAQEGKEPQGSKLKEPNKPILDDEARTRIVLRLQKESPPQAGREQMTTAVVLAEAAITDSAIERIILESPKRSFEAQRFIARRMLAGDSATELKEALRREIRNFQDPRSIDQARWTVRELKEAGAERYPKVREEFQLYDGELEVKAGSEPQRDNYKNSKGELQDEIYQKAHREWEERKALEEKYDPPPEPQPEAYKDAVGKSDVDSFRRAHDEWQAKAASPEEIQRHNALIEELTFQQKFLDELNDPGAETTRLRKMADDLREGYTPRPRKDVKFNADEARQYVEKIEARIAHIDAEAQARNTEREAQKSFEIAADRAEDSLRIRMEKEAENRLRVAQQEQIRREREEQMQQRATEHHMLGLNEEQKKEFIDHPEEQIEKWMRVQMRHRGFVSEDAAQQRVRVYLDFIESGEFEEKWRIRHGERFIDVNSRDREFKRLQGEMSEYVSAHLYLKFAESAVNGGQKNFEAVVEYLSRAGTSGWHIVYNANNGMNGIGYELYLKELEALRGAPRNMKRRLGPEEFRRAKENVANFIMQNSDAFGDKWDVKNLTTVQIEEAAKHFANAGEILAITRQKRPMIMIKGLGPSERSFLLGILNEANAYVDPVSEESIAGAYDWVRFFEEKWGNLSPHQQRMLEYVFEFTAIDMGYGHEVDHMISEMKQSGTYKASRDTAIHNRWSEDPSKKDLKKWKAVSHGPMVLAFDNDNAIVKSFGLSASDIEYKRLLLAERGKRIFGELLESYDHDSSGWRAEGHLDQIGKLFEKPETMGLGYWLLRASAPYLDVREDEADRIFREGNPGEITERRDRISGAYWSDDPSNPETYGRLSIYKVLKQMASYEPQVNGLMMVDNQEESFMEWWYRRDTIETTRSMLGVGEDAPEVTYYDVYREIMGRVVLIEDRLAREQLPRIDYSQGFAELPPEKQGKVREIVTKVISKTGGKYKISSVDVFMDYMKQLSNVTNQEEHIMAFRKPVYRRHLKRTQETFSARFYMLENPDKVQNPVANRGEIKSLSEHLKERHDELYPLSDTLTEAGKGGRDPLPRSWRDLGVALSLVPVVRDALVQGDDKKFLDAIDKLKSIEIYNGQTKAFRAVTYILAGHGKFGEVDPGLTSFFGLNELANSSEWKRYVGDHGKSFDLKDKDALIDKLSGLYGKLDLYPHLKHSTHLLEEYLGISTRDIIFGLRTAEPIKLPFYINQGKFAVGAIALLLSLEGVKLFDTAVSGKSS